VSDIVRMRNGALEELTRHAAEAWPEECCGLLIGRGDRIETVMRTRNAAEDRARRFLVDPADHFEAIRAARADGLTIVGAYHSHPDGEPVPSPTDRRDAFEDPAFIHLIVRPASADRPGPATAAAYRLTGSGFVRIELAVEPEPDGRTLR
jgi:desampylase